MSPRTTTTTEKLPNWTNSTRRWKVYALLPLKKLISKDMDITTSEWENLSFLLANFAIRNPANIDEWRDAQLTVIEEINEILEPQIDALPSETEIDTTQLEEINKFRDRLLLPGGYRELSPLVLSEKLQVAFDRWSSYWQMHLKEVSSSRPIDL